jgi:hypothetical protein
MFQGVLQKKKEGGRGIMLKDWLDSRSLPLIPLWHERSLTYLPLTVFDSSPFATSK